MTPNPLARLATFGQSIWLDYIRRDMISSGKLSQLIEEDGLRGLTSNPKIFEKAIVDSDDYDDAIRQLAQAGHSAREIYDRISIEDVQNAADLFRSTFEQSEGQHGFVSLEVSPHLAHDTDGTIAEAKWLWDRVDRPNVLIKVPGTQEGLPAISQLIRDGINVNVTLLFGLPRYREVAEAYISGLEDRCADGNSVNDVTSVASFFLSRIDVLVDALLEKRLDAGGESGHIAGQLKGQVAIASAKLAYQIYKEAFADERFRTLARQGAGKQRVLWASTSTKNPHYSDVKYVEALIGPETVNTVPPETLDAFRDHGNPAPRLEQDLKQAKEVFFYLPELGIDIDKVTKQLEDEGVEKFNQPFDKLLDTLEKRRANVLNGSRNEQRLELGELSDQVEDRLVQLERDDFCARLWKKDPHLWKLESAHQETIVHGLGWLDAPNRIQQDLTAIDEIVKDVKQAGFQHVVHMGMGGSSLAPLVFQRTFASSQDGLSLTVLDTTDPATILNIEQTCDLDKTLFIVASKSGTTAEPRAFEQYFYHQMKKRKGDRAGEHFVAITDPGTALDELAVARKYRGIFRNFPDVGGRYSALTYFGLVPAALMGLNVRDLLRRVQPMVEACGANVPPRENPGVLLGAVMGELARHDRDKVTLLASSRLQTLGIWLEQLIAESSGKEGKGVIPVAGEPMGDPEVYGRDRQFIAIIQDDGEEDPQFAQHLDSLRNSGCPIVTIHVGTPLDLVQEFFRWEIAVATACSVLNIDAFDQPNVQESKDNTGELLNRLQQTGQLPEEKPAV